MGVPASRGSGKYNNRIGKFTPRNPEKFRGQYPIIFKSKLESRMMVYLDNNTNVKAWVYEPKPIPYIDKSSKNHPRRNYWIDFMAEMFINDVLKKVWIEVKSKGETVKPRKRNGVLIVESVKTYIKNLSKWAAAKELAKRSGAIFIIATEDFFKQ